MKITRILLAHIRELVDRGMTPINMARAMAISLEEVNKLIILSRKRHSVLHN